MAAADLWNDHRFEAAVVAAADAVVEHVRGLAGQPEPSGANAWEQVFPFAPPTGTPRLRWRGDPSDAGIVRLSDGLHQFAAGVQALVRIVDIPPAGDAQRQEAFERLAALSLLTRWVSACELVQP